MIRMKVFNLIELDKFYIASLYPLKFMTRVFLNVNSLLLLVIGRI